MSGRLVSAVKLWSVAVGDGPGAGRTSGRRGTGPPPPSLVRLESRRRDSALVLVLILAALYPSTHPMTLAGGQAAFRGTGRVDGALLRSRFSSFASLRGRQALAVLRLLFHTHASTLERGRTAVRLDDSSFLRPLTSPAMADPKLEPEVVSLIPSTTLTPLRIFLSLSILLACLVVAFVSPRRRLEAPVAALHAGKKKKGARTVVLVGPLASGKTALFSRVRSRSHLCARLEFRELMRPMCVLLRALQLVYGSAQQTHTSMRENEAVVKAKWGVGADTVVEKGEKEEVEVRQFTELLGGCFLLEKLLTDRRLLAVRTARGCRTLDAAPPRRPPRPPSLAHSLARAVPPGGRRPHLYHRRRDRFDGQERARRGRVRLSA